ncbi:aminoglycoside phosphotransferase family protein [Litorilinea aerophila]|uniref:Aminoglycoside phosphotransferase family protein n=1 Tax=Litorilinea aerophila TaxID=1204385 RepID=A0A540VL25_9CHLR|nr:aminoglycoside phosphotransferase family protein [Litorilinea aerophila]MCC9075102.1 aminoglycoside phosphotransferase family protein [Litorilinea aerophila]
MTHTKMHADELTIPLSLVRRLVADQFPRWAHLPLEPVPSAGTDNAMYRLGDEMAVRLPRVPWAAGQVAREQRWLPRLAPHLPLAVPTPLALGRPAYGYPWHWSIYRWLPGENATRAPLADPAQAAIALAGFITALQGIDPTGGPRPGPGNSSRGVPLAARDAQVRAAIAALDGAFDADAVTAAWEAALRVPVWDGPPVWIHGDLQGGNLLVQDGQLCAVIDFGCLGVGDPACDLQVAWNFFAAEARAVFRASLAVDEATWARGRGWALSVGVIAYPYYRESNPVLAGIARHAIQEVLAEERLAR